jgi:aminoglycoside phosphotransferase
LTVRLRSLLEVIHPHGRVLRAVVVGRGCPESLRPEAAPHSPFDLVVLAPTESELRGPSLARELREAVRNLAPQGVAYGIAPRGRRRAVRQMLMREGLTLRLELAHFPDFDRSTFVFPLHRDPARYVLGRLALLSRAGAAAVHATAWRPILLRASLRSVGIICTHDPAARPFRWAETLVGNEGQQMKVAIARTRPGTASSFVLFLFSRGSLPTALVKIASGTAKAALEREVRMLRLLAPRARLAGARVPEAVGSSTSDDAAVIVETPLDGRPGAILLHRKPRRLEDVTRPVAAWLAHWNVATARRCCLASELLESEVLAPARALASVLGDGRGYVARLEELCDRALGLETVLVDRHGDLTMWNVLVGEAAIGIVDWEAAKRHVLPLVDFYYAVTDAVAATEGYADRPAAFRACFGPAGVHQSLVRELESRISGALELRPQTAELAFHACWLQHAENEVARQARAGPFTVIVDAIASSQIEFER